MPVEAQIKQDRIVSENPADGSIVAEFTIATPLEVREAVARAKGAQRAWAARGIRDRLQILRRFQQLLLRNQQQVAELITREAGKPLAESLTTEVLVVLDAARYLLDHA